MEVNLALGGQLTKADGEISLVKSWEVGRENLEYLKLCAAYRKWREMSKEMKS